MCFSGARFVRNVAVHNRDFTPPTTIAGGISGTVVGGGATDQCSTVTVDQDAARLVAASQAESASSKCSDLQQVAAR